MTPHKTAVDLFNDYYSYLKANLMYDEEARQDAIECSLIAIDTFMPLLRKMHNHPHFKEDMTEYTYEYWIEVKKEINKM
jgi:hypothetical protein